MTLSCIVFSLRKVFRPSATHWRNPFIPTMVPLLSIILPSPLRSNHKTSRTLTKATMKMRSMKIIKANRTTVGSSTSQVDIGLPGQIRLTSQAMVPPRISHSL